MALMNMVEQDDKKVIYWYQKAAEAGNEDAAIELERCRQLFIEK